MEGLPISIFDIAVFGVVLLSALVAFSSGLVKSLLFLLTWVGAVAVAYLFFPQTQPIANGLIKDIPVVADIAAAIVPFVLTLIVLSVFADVVGKMVHASGFRMIDRSLGLALGVAFGCFIVSLLFLFYLYLFPNQTPPKWLAEARTLPALEQGARLIEKFLPADFRRKLGERGEGAGGQGVLSPADKQIPSLPPKPN